ncbi:ParB N-terminal domain-containing protein [Seohaeicola saemankumensis]|nr:ParB N-terminal domain-containing protein [Seohaeicola saemankumensis]MCA0873428.1 ParB N-terminal domain-containing protein [Seohaeicola saemankumensis]
MAKRKRLTPAQSDYLTGSQPAETPRPAALSAAPIAQVAGEASARAALADLADAMEAARAEGRMLEQLPLDEIDAQYLVRDRIEQDEEEMHALMDSLRARGQQMPIEVTRIEGAKGPRYGLISGWRRLTALRRLYSVDHDPRFATVRAMVIAPGSAQAAYLAMVEENEIRVNLSLYERARITVRAMHEHVYPTQRAALQGLFASTTRSKRSKIGSFIALVESLDRVLKFPTAIPEKLGLALAREMVRDPQFGSRVRAVLRGNEPDTPGAELRILEAAVRAAQAPAGSPEDTLPLPPHAPVHPPEPEAPATPPKVKKTPRPRIRSGGPEALDGERIAMPAGKDLQLWFSPSENRIELSGAAVDQRLAEDLQTWLRRRI